MKVKMILGRGRQDRQDKEIKRKPRQLALSDAVLRQDSECSSGTRRLSDSKSRVQEARVRLDTPIPIFRDPKNKDPRKRPEKCDPLC